MPVRPMSKTKAKVRHGYVSRSVLGGTVPDPVEKSMILIHQQATEGLAVSFHLSSQAPIFGSRGTFTRRKVTNIVTGNLRGFRPAAGRPTGRIFQVDAAATGN